MMPLLVADFFVICHIPSTWSAHILQLFRWFQDWQVPVFDSVSLPISRLEPLIVSKLKE